MWASEQIGLQSAPDRSVTPSSAWGETLARGTNHKVRRDQFSFGSQRFFLPGDPQGKVCSGLSNIFTSLIDGRQRNAQEIRVGKVSATYYRDILRNAKARI
jgi:hypothetical protein